MEYQNVINLLSIEAQKYVSENPKWQKFILFLSNWFVFLSVIFFVIIWALSDAFHTLYSRNILDIILSIFVTSKVNKVILESKYFYLIALIPLIIALSLKFIFGINLSFLGFLTAMLLVVKIYKNKQ